MRIAWFHSHIMFWSGGAKFIYETASRLSLTARVDIYVEQCSDELRKMFALREINVIEFGVRSSTSYLYWLFFPYYLKRGIKFMQPLQEHYDVFITTMFPMHYEVYRAGLHPSLAYMFEPFAFFHDKDQIGGLSRIRRILLSLLAALYKPLDIKGTEKADCLMTINKGTQAWVKSTYGRNASTSFLGVDSALFSPKKFNPYRKKYQDRKTLIHSTDWTPLKQTDRALEIVSIIKKELPEILLLISCSSLNPTEIKRVKRKIKALDIEKHVEILGILSHEELPYYYALADLSLYTGIGRGASSASLFVLECMACGTPGIRTNFTDDEIRHNVSGYLYRPEDMDACIKYILDLLCNEDKRHRFGRAAREYVLVHYRWENVAKRILEEAESLLLKKVPS